MDEVPLLSQFQFIIENPCHQHKLNKKTCFFNLRKKGKFNTLYDIGIPFVYRVEK